RGRTILVVDDEPDILETVEEALDMCVVHKAKDQDTAVEYIKDNRYDIAILDIMGVGGFELLKQTTAKGTPTVMLTAHAMTSESLTRAAKLGAVSFLPKEKIMELQSFLEDIIQASGRPVWKKLFDRLAPYFRKRFGWNPEEEKDVVTELQDLEGMEKK
ncbi:MAG: response regulator, partial [Desulfobacterales bacterium]|nr:response regulator [Desulfobacterales bacterium]